MPNTIREQQDRPATITQLVAARNDERARIVADAENIAAALSEHGMLVEYAGGWVDETERSIDAAAKVIRDYLIGASNAE